jgi:hypothetical protein
MITSDDLLSLLNQQDFESWLSTKRKDGYAGARASACDCPIAEWLHKAYGLSLEVHKSQIIFNGEKIENPDWVKYFVKQVDSKQRFSTFCTPEEAIFILKCFDNNAIE